MDIKFWNDPEAFAKAEPETQDETIGKYLSYADTLCDAEDEFLNKAAEYTCVALGIPRATYDRFMRIMRYKAEEDIE